MHDKLSQAVKLYDNLLSEQLARPSWRAAPSQQYGLPTRSQTLESYQPQYAYATVPPMAAQPQQVQSPMQQHPYAMSAPPEPQSWAPQQHSDPAVPQWQQTAPVSQPQQPYLSAAPPPHQSTYSPQLNQQQQYQSAPPPPQQHAAPASSPYFAGPSPPQSYATSPAAVVHSPATYGAPQHPSPAQGRAPGLSRHNTLQAQPTRQPVYQQQRPASMIAPPSQSPLPLFPTAPTSNPQQYSMDMFSPPQGLIEQTEKKEAALISFD